MATFLSVGPSTVWEFYNMKCLFKKLSKKEMLHQEYDRPQALKNYCSLPSTTSHVLQSYCSSKELYFDNPKD